jgi:hypothetical protein
MQSKTGELSKMVFQRAALQRKLQQARETGDRETERDADRKIYHLTKKINEKQNNYWQEHLAR